MTAEQRQREIYDGMRARGERVRVLVTDDPWPYDDALPGAGRGASKHYDCSPLDRIKATPLPPLHDDAVLFLWRTHSFGRVAYDVMEARGFEYKTEIVWLKRSVCSRCRGEGVAMSKRYVEQTTIPLSDAPTRVYDGKTSTTCAACEGRGEKDHFGMGRIVRAQHEVCLVGVRGRMNDRVLSRSVRSAFETIEDSEIVAPRARHSEKPEAFYRLVETLFPGPYFELHARTPRAGWMASGNQLELAQPLSEKSSAAPRNPVR
jgi:N6-adenosine-specific RNA methylase IME4